ncbi:MAG: hypothetical protein QG622_890 [Actinomycetota bacterium]|nr:hypothetical protein [Actinomycetota bacterium]
MSVFRRRRRTEAEEAAESRPEGPESGTTDGADEGPAGGTDETDGDGADYFDEEWDRSEGPWDVSERPGTDGYVDLGGLRLQGRDGMELRLELDEATGAVSSATVQLGASAVQLQAFAAPRSEGIWVEIREEIREGISRQGGQVDEVPGAFGRELIARIPARSPDGRTGHTAARFVGVDGPRWFLRAVFSGEAVHKPKAAEDLEAAVRGLVVVRGPEAMAPRELLPLRLPEAAPQPTSADDESLSHDDLRPFERGPEITEVR